MTEELPLLRTALRPYNSEAAFLFQQAAAAKIASGQTLSEMQKRTQEVANIH